MRPADAAEGRRLTLALQAMVERRGSLLGLMEDAAVTSLVEQIIESQRRNRYVAYLVNRPDLAVGSLDPHSGIFDPVRAAIIHRRNGNLDEAFWMIFLYAHFGKNRRSGYGYAADIYGALGQVPTWTWQAIVEDVSGFRAWLAQAAEAIRARHRPGGFGNHRKYESLDAWSPVGTGAVVESYVDWVGDDGHVKRIEAITGFPDGQGGFDLLFDAMAEVRRFGRTARFDWLMMAYKVGLLASVPTHAYLRGATGPRRGVSFLATGAADKTLPIRELEGVVAALEKQLFVGYDVLEDAICNWQKSPLEFKPFRG